MAQSKNSNSKPAQRKPREDRQVQVNPGDNAAYLKHSMRLSALPKISMQDAPAVAQRVDEYFQICQEDDMKPSVAGLCLALDTDRTYLWEIRTGKTKNNEVTNIIKRATKTLELQLINYFQNGKINPVAGIFLLKNHFGYKDQQETVVKVQADEPTKDIKELEAKYKESVVVELEDGVTVLSPPKEGDK